MKDNRFYQHRMAIKALCDQKNVTVDVGSRIYAHDRGWANYTQELNEWDALCIKYMRDKSKGLADLFR